MPQSQDRTRKLKSSKHNQNYQNILRSTPITLRIQNSIGEEEAVLIEKLSLINQQAQHYRNHHQHAAGAQDGGVAQQQEQEDQQNNNSGSSRPPSRISNEAFNRTTNNCILRMSPQSQQKFFTSLEKIYKEQDYQKLRSDFIEEPYSPEYTIVRALDDSCVLFAVKENQSSQNGFDNTRFFESENNSGQNSGFKMQSPNVNRNFYDQEVECLNDPEIIQQLAQRLQNIENQENVPNVRRNELKKEQQMRGGLLVESFSTDRQFLMIHPRNLKKLTPTLKAPQISRQPSIKSIDYFDLSIPYHAVILCQRLLDLRNLEEESSQDTNEENQQQEAVGEQQNEQLEDQVQEIPQQMSVDQQTSVFESQEQSNQVSAPNSHNKTPLPSLVPPSRGENQEIDIDLLINKLLEIPHDELLDSLLNLSINENDVNNNNNGSNNLQNQEQQNDPTLQNSVFHQQGRDSDQNSDFTSSGIQTPGSNSFSTPIQAKIFYEKGNLINGGKQQRGLDLRSPQTKFNLMRKLQEVKELNNSSDEDEIANHTIAGSQMDEMTRFNNGMSSMDNTRILSHNGTQIHTGRGMTNNGGQQIDCRIQNDFSRLFINEEDEEEKEEDDGQVEESPDECRSIQDKERETTKPISLISPQRSLNSTYSQLQLRNMNQHQPSIELLILKLKILEEKRLRSGLNGGAGRFGTSSNPRITQTQSHYSSETDSPQKIEYINGAAGGGGLSQSHSVSNFNANNNSATSLLEQVIKRLESLKRSRDASV
ncbi:UNKNOWN [Stylonychia lemnae]|uniref:Uncharacterized protein n=1 Tax=Stylonychia lemnae TaxID=5949 RepID=A0A078AR87_STYLE|nr:UNKNOWN [Stylonychia lemnae]|eukprot:CDW84940.1 UNKNOWN [Stylonychia lemnae]